MAPDRASGTASATPPAARSTAKRATSPAITIAATATTSPSCATSACKAYRFSISWSRILPDGTGKVNPSGLDFYSRLVDELLANGIQPLATLYHWDLPAALDDRGGWLNRDVASWFAEYAQTMFRALDDRVPMWSTLNEPWVVSDGGYLHGALAPGHRNRFEAPIASHNLLRAHAAALEAYRGDRQEQDRHRGQPRAEVRRLRERRGRRSDATRRRVHEPPVSRSALLRRVPAGDAGDLRRGVAGVSLLRLSSSSASRSISSA